MSSGFATDPRFSAIAITGGPCAGKSTFLSQATQRLQDYGLRVAVLAEGATELITAGFSPFDTWKTPRDFQKFVLMHNLGREERYYQMLKALAVDDRPLVLLCDRGALDGRAYVSHEDFMATLSMLSLDLHALRERYRSVIHLVTAADGAEAFYTLTNNTARSETPEQARALDRRTRDAWLGHPHLQIIDNTTNFAGKMDRAIAALARVLNMPEPLEKERKFLVLAYDATLMPTAVGVEIEQTYLTMVNHGVERRVRLRRIDGGESYTYTEKELTERLGVRVERERTISQRRYRNLLRERNWNARTIKKTRYCFAFEGHHFELDIYYEPKMLIILEVEVDDLDALISLPPCVVQSQEVTGDPYWSNAAIARR